MQKLLFFIVTAVFSLSIMAQSDQVRGHPTHSGLYISMSAGLAYLSINDDITNGPNETMTLKGIGGAFDFKLGAVIKENFILHGDLIITTSGSIDVTLDGEPAGTISGENSVAINMFGAGATYYFMPQSFFISGTVGPAWYSITSDEATSNTQKGFGLDMKVGKEWFVSKNWDLGGSIGFNYTKINNEVDTMTEKLSGISVRLSFNATFN